MALQVDIASMRREVEAAESFRKLHLADWRRTIERFHGPAYMRNTAASGKDDPENFVHEYVALVLPRIVHDNPKVRVRSSNAVVQKTTAERMMLGMNRWAKMTKVRTTLERISTDMLLYWGASLVVNEPVPGHRDGDAGAPYLPRVYRLSPERFFVDPAATNKEDARYMGHSWIVDKADLLNECDASPDSWDREMVEGLGTGTDVAETRGNDEAARNIPDRKEVVVAEMFVPGVFDKDAEDYDKYEKNKRLYGGTIYTMVKGQASGTVASEEGGTGKESRFKGFARRPRLFYGPREGPYDIFGCYTVSDDPYPLGAICALIPQIDDLNAHLRSMRYSAAAYKRILVFNGKDKDLAQKIQDKPDLYVVFSDTIEPDDMKMFEVGGITEQQVKYAMMAQDRLDRVGGIHDAMRGNITGQATATEISVAEGGATMRLSHLKRQFQECVDSVLGKVAWYLFHDNRIRFNLGEDAMEPLGEADPVFSASSMVGDFEDLELTVDAMSMERVSESVLQNKAMTVLTVAAQVAQFKAQFPSMGWDEIVSMIGDSLNIPNLESILGGGAAQGAPPQAGAPGAAPAGAAPTQTPLEGMGKILAQGRRS